MGASADGFAGAAEAGRAWEAVLRHIEGQLVAGILKPGDHLAAERALAAELGVGRSSVREAIRVLEAFGLVSTRAGSGPQSGAVIIARPTGGMSALVRLQVAAQGFAVADVVATRVVLESAVVGELAAGAGGFAHGTGETGARTAHPGLGEARELLDAMEHPAGGPLDRDEFLTLDQAFHLALAVASGNAVIAATLSGLRDAIEQYLRVGAAALEDWPATRARLTAEHRAIVAAIDAGDADAARTRIRDHIEDYHAETVVSGIHH
ncbi:FadR/GntR family transcriptional regulator [Herbiconiux liangxiaofengii]|uniref:FadR/GntR family transcriptional regulator n=1 Tax=Herbiconiux liangxiaofengii TaxID=3342795 RepID=UPI0035BB8B42